MSGSVTSSVRVTGLSDLMKFFDELPAKLQNNVMRGAMREGANVVRQEAKNMAPIATPSSNGAKKYGHYRGALRDSIKVSTRSRAGKVSAVVSAGGKNKRGADVFYVHWVEFGTAAHFIKAKANGKNYAGRLNYQGRKNGGALSINGKMYASVFHPGSRPKPFMRPALDSRAQQAVVAVGEAIKRRLTKQGLNAQDVEIREA